MIRAGSLVAGACVFFSVAHAQASGLSAARFGGEHGHPTTDNPTAIYYNPAGLGLSKGTHIFVDGTLALRWTSYDRPASETLDTVDPSTGLTINDSELAPGANDGRATLFNAITAPFLGISSDFGTDFIYAGLAGYVPFGGSAEWDKNSTYADDDPRFPGAYDGQQRWYSIDGSTRSIYLTGAVAFNIRKIGLSIGVSGSAIRTSLETIRARNANGSDDLLTGTGEEALVQEGRSYADLVGWQGGFGVGLVYDVLKKGRYFIGASYTSQPNVAGGMTLSGTLDNTFGLGTPDRSDIELTQTYPDIIRLGFRVRPTDKYELRLFGDYSRWSVFTDQCIITADAPVKNCDYPGASNALDDPESYGANEPDPGDGDFAGAGVVQQLPRFWNDAFGVRLGGSYWFIPSVEGFLGVGYDGTAVPLETLEPAFIDMHKFTVSVGAKWQIIKHLAMSLTATEVIYLRTDTDGKGVLNRFQSPTRQPGNNGEYRQFIQLFNLYADISF